MGDTVRSSVTFNKEARAAFVRFATSPEAAWTANFRDFNAAVVRMATLAAGGRITTDIVRDEVNRLTASWEPANERPEDDSCAVSSTRTDWPSWIASTACSWRKSCVCVPGPGASPRLGARCSRSLVTGARPRMTLIVCGSIWRASAWRGGASRRERRTVRRAASSDRLARNLTLYVTRSVSFRR
jgi:hypothetical protein